MPSLRPQIPARRRRLIPLFPGRHARRSLLTVAFLVAPALAAAQPAGGQPPAGQPPKPAPEAAKPKPAAAKPPAAKAGGPTFVRLETTAGTILVVLSPEIAPHHAANFAHLAKTGFYTGSYFHRVIPGFMIQGGDPNTKNADRADDGMGGPTWKDVLTPEELATPDAKSAAMAKKGIVDNHGTPGLKGEFSTTVKHLRGILSMARTNDPNSAGSQFFLMVADYPSLDGKYSIFGHVVTGIEVADKIVASPRDARDNPLESIKINKATVLEGTGQLSAAELAAFQKGAPAKPAPK